MSSSEPAPAVTRADVRAARQALGERIVTTPVHRWRSARLEPELGADTELHLKLELFQVTGTFKARGAFCVMQQLAPDVLARGVTAVSAGNHALAEVPSARAA